MLRMRLDVNGTEIRMLSAKRIRDNGEPFIYEVKDELGKLGEVKHYYGDGAEKLAAKMLQLWLWKQNVKGDCKGGF